MRQRSSYPEPFKVQVVQECLQPGATVSSVAIRHGINANVIRKWLPLYRDQLPAALPAFVPLRATPKRPTAASVIIELSLGGKRLANTPPRFFQLAAWCPPVFGGHHFKPLAEDLPC
ncbi:IS66-like element accessory protein TnpA, partial [Pseudomonas aeruginosa]